MSVVFEELGSERHHKVSPWETTAIVSRDSLGKGKPSTDVKAWGLHIWDAEPVKQWAHQGIFLILLADSADRLRIMVATSIYGVSFCRMKWQTSTQLKACLNLDSCCPAKLETLFEDWADMWHSEMFVHEPGVRRHGLLCFALCRSVWQQVLAAKLHPQTLSSL